MVVDLKERLQKSAVVFGVRFKGLDVSLPSAKTRPPSPPPIFGPPLAVEGRPLFLF